MKPAPLGRPDTPPTRAATTPLSPYFQKIASRNIPYTLTLEVTRRCNLSCRHCFSIEAGGREELSTEEMCDAISQARALGTFTILMTGGEATGHPDFLDLVAHARALGMLVHFYTNATLVTPRLARRLADLGVAKVGISLYGAVAGTHDWLTKEPGSFEKTVRGASLLKEAGVPAYFKMLINERNYAEFPAMRELAGRLGVDFKHCINIYERNNLDRTPTDLRTGTDEETHYWSAFWDVHFEELSEESRKTRGQAIGCGIGRSDVTITPYGDVLACMTIPISAGNVRERPLREIWERAPLFRSLREHREDEVGCSPCQYLSLCTRCPGMGFLENGSIYSASSLSCNMTMRAYRTGVDESAPRSRSVPPTLAGTR
ncbi:MAG: radical SAM protein [Planctomycetes bacterium]|nr:radical SAM protein [Planctomycetota bacterium]